MRVSTTISLLMAAVLLGGNVPAALAAGGGEDISPAEQRVFTDPHMDGLPPASTLRYDYRRHEAGQPPVADEVILTTQHDAQRGRVTQVDYLHEDRHLVLPEVDQASSNPLILYFLEADVRTMRARLGGQENYFRRRIRLALAESAQLSELAVSYGGKTVQATQVLIQPYVNDELQARFQGMAHKSYLFTLSPQVPGGVYELRTVVEDAAAGAPRVEEVLTLRAQ
ncbi:MAG: hypothetical protein Q7J47_15465 [Azoarcus sp.]|nr:hypothetical protein [Azoarcus sp.]